MEIKSIMSFLFLLQALINVLNLAEKIPPMPIPVSTIDVYRCRKSGTSTSTNYKNNLISALNTVAKNIGGHNGFYHASAGKTEQVNAIGLCPSYLNYYLCELCVNKSIPLLQKNCPNQKEGVTWVADCMLRYSDRKINGVLDDWVWVHLPAKETVVQPREMDKALYDLETRLQKEASGGTSVRKFASGNTTYGNMGLPPKGKFDLYAVMQCTPDLTKDQCSKCLSSIILTSHSCCSGKIAARMLSPSCYMRYEETKFDDTRVISPKGTNMESEKKKG